MTNPYGPNRADRTEGVPIEHWRDPSDVLDEERRHKGLPPASPLFASFRRLSWRYRVAAAAAVLAVVLLITAAQQWGTKKNWLSAVVEIVVAMVLFAVAIWLMRGSRRAGINGLPRGHGERQRP